MEKEDTQPPNPNVIPESEVNMLLDKIKIAMRESGLREDVVEGTRIIVIHPEDWEVSLLVPYRNTKTAQIRKPVEDILFRMCGVEDRCCDYFGKQKPKESYEWYFRHPNIPQDIYDRLEQEIEMELGEEIGMGLPKPSIIKSKDTPAFVTVREDVFEQIRSGVKTTEYRNLNQYYCDKFFPNGKQKKLIKFNRGYRTGRENQMVFEINSIVLVSERGNEIPAYSINGKLIVSYEDIPSGFAPVAYGIKLGKRIS
jgi:hypothetical protein